jgi:hypothetical protein
MATTDSCFSEVSRYRTIRSGVEQDFLRRQRIRLYRPTLPTMTSGADEELTIQCHRGFKFDLTPAQTPTSIQDCD